MNSAEEISQFREPINTYHSASVLKKGHLHHYDFPLDEKSPKKEKKWSIGNLFRRKKKNDSSSDEERNKNSGKKKRKSVKAKKSVPFDHVLVVPQQRLTSGYSNADQDNGVLSDPTGRFTKYALATRLNGIVEPISNIVKNDKNDARLHEPVDQIDTLGDHRKSRKDLAKQRAEARRTSQTRHSSSDEDSQVSSSSHKFRSEDSLTKRDTSSSRRSRAARTERYLKRHSRDFESSSGHLRMSKSDVDSSSFLRLSDDSNKSPSRSPLSSNQVSYSNLPYQTGNISGLSTIPPSHTSHRVSNSTSNPSYKPPLSINEYNRKVLNLENVNHQQRSVSDVNIHRSRPDDEVLHVQIPLTRSNPRFRNLSLVDNAHLQNVYRRQAPPQPPPRDPRRLVNTNYFDNNNLNTYLLNLDNDVQLRRPVYNNSVDNVRKCQSFNLNPKFRSTSEDHIPVERSVLIQRPSSAQPSNNLNRDSGRGELRSRSDNFQYMTDKHPRSRKPIVVQQSLTNLNRTEMRPSNVRTWIKNDSNTEDFLEKLRAKKMNSSNPQMFTSHTQVQNQVFLPSVLNISNGNDEIDHTKAYTSKSLPKEVKYGELNPAQDNSTSKDTFLKSDDNHRTSGNLEDALHELETIYNSLRLGDDDLLERAEKREKAAAEKKALTNSSEVYPEWSNTYRGTMSDSSFSYEYNGDSLKRRRMFRKPIVENGTSQDKVHLNITNTKIGSNILDPHVHQTLNSISHSTPVCAKFEDDEDEGETVPDVTLDDVVYRTIKRANSVLKVPERQPPFGIPLGPITLAANSDYLHAIPDEVPTPKPSKIPDLVKDDLAYRSLRKDTNKDPTLPPLSADDLKNNNQFEFDKVELRPVNKKREIRAHSATIGSLISQDVIDRANRRSQCNNNLDDEYKTLTDIADAMTVARDVLRAKEMKINEIKRASMSDTDAGIKYVRYPRSRDGISTLRMNFFNSMNDGMERNKVEKANKNARRFTTSIDFALGGSTLVSHNDNKLSQFDEDLTKIALEAKEASERITKELEELDRERGRRNKSEKGEDNKGRSLEECDVKSGDCIDLVDDQKEVSEGVKCEELLKSEESKTKDVNDVKQVVEDVNEEPPIMESVATIVFKHTLPRKDKKLTKDSNVLESDHDYENLEEEDDRKEVRTPFEERKNEIIATFQNLEKADEKSGFSSDSLQILNDKKLEDVSSGETCVVDVVKSVVSVQLSLECAASDLKNKMPFDVNRACSSGYHSQTSVGLTSIDSDISLNSCEANFDSLESLKSPKLVLATSKISDGEVKGRDAMGKDFTRDKLVKKGGNNSNNCLENCNRKSNRGDTLDSSCTWYKNPMALALACSYGFACAHQLCSLDLFAIFGILFAVLTVIAALFI